METTAGSNPRGAQLGRLRELVATNGLGWTITFAAERFFAALASRLDRRLAALEERRGLSGINGVERNYRLWNFRDWSDGGEDWTQSPEWKQSLIDEVMYRWLEPGKDVLEVGPGAGRWTEAIEKRARRVILVDLSERCIEACRRRFATAAERIEYHVNDGRSLPFLAEASVDFVWSFDTFVHVAPPDTDAYLAEFRRVLRPGGRAVIHHPRLGRAQGGYRSAMTAKRFLQLLAAHDLRLVTQLEAWGPEGCHSVRLHSDIITVFER